MEESLYSESGFFNTTKVRSNIEGDFLTSPEVSKYFGKFISHWMNENKIKSNVVEIGAGTGSLATQIQEYSTNNLFLVEKSKTAFRILKQKEFNVFETLDLIPVDKVNLVYMNEVLDNIPCSVGVYKDGVWLEKIIKIESDSLSYELAPMRPENLTWIESNNIEPLDDIEIEIQRNATKYLEGIVSRFNPNYLLIIDYGYEFHERSSIPYKSLIRTYKNHHLAGETLLQPTTTDITYDVNFL
jgi:SAM-dependent MidA family methyltransferase